MKVVQGNQNILIIDDDPQICRIFGLKLKLAGFNVWSTTSGIEGIKIINSDKPDAVLLDILMPEISGFEVLERVRKFSNVPIVVFTARTETITKALEMGANDSLAKPVDPERLVEKIKHVLEKSHHGTSEYQITLDLFSK